MPTRASPEVREARKQALAPLFDYMTARGTHRSWLARQLDISVARVWNYEHGYNTPPEWFVARACKALGVTPRKLVLATSDIRDKRGRRARKGESHHERDSHPVSHQSQQSHQRGTADSSTTRRKSQARSARGNAHGDHGDPPERADPRVASGPR